MTTRLLLSLFFLLTTAPAALASEQQSALSREFLQSYEQLLVTPTDRSLNFKYASLAMQLRDYESAIPPLERVLMSEPDNAKLRLQLGILYNALKSSSIAQEYFQSAIDTPGAPADVVEEARVYLNGM